MARQTVGKKKATQRKFEAKLRQRKNSLKEKHLVTSGKKKANKKQSQKVGQKKNKVVKKPAGYSSTVLGARKERNKNNNESDSEDGTDSEDDFEEDPEFEDRDYGELDEGELQMKKELEEQRVTKAVSQRGSKKKWSAEEKHKIEEQIAKAQLTHEQIQESLKAAQDEIRIENAVGWELLAQNRENLLFSCIKASSREQYESRKNTVVKAGFGWNVQGLYGFFTSGKVAATVGNKLCEAVLSAYKLMWSIEHDGAEMDKNDEELLRLVLRARKNKCPDMPRIVGAIGKDRLMELHALYKARYADKSITKEEYIELQDASTMLYCCALRIFQLRSLTQTSLWFSDKNKKIAWVTVPAKTTSQGRFVEKKVVHPDFIAAARDMVDRRKENKDTVLFPLWAKAAHGESDASRLKFEDLMKKLNQEAANVFKWPAVTSFHGTHNFRHGAAQDAFAENGVELVMLRTGHLSVACAEHYARSDLERLRRSKFAELSAAKQHNELKSYLTKIKAKVIKMTSECNIKLSSRSAKANDPGCPLYNPGTLDEQEYQRLLENCRRNTALISERPKRRKRDEKSEQMGNVAGNNGLADEFLMVEMKNARTVMLTNTNGIPQCCWVPADAEVYDHMLMKTAVAILRSYYKKHPKMNSSTLCDHPVAASFMMINGTNFNC